MVQEDVTAIVERFWREALSIDAGASVDVRSFFELGGTSLQAVALAARLEQRLDVELTALSIHDHPTPKSLALHIESMRQLRSGDDEEEGVL